MNDGYIVQELGDVFNKENFCTYAIYHYTYKGESVEVEFEKLMNAKSFLPPEFMRYLESRYPGYTLHTRYRYVSLSGTWCKSVFNIVILGDIPEKSEVDALC